VRGQGSGCLCGRAGERAGQQVGSLASAVLDLVHVAAIVGAPAVWFQQLFQGALYFRAEQWMPTVSEHLLVLATALTPCLRLAPLPPPPTS